jgi:hypothetical protein
VGLPAGSSGPATSPQRDITMTRDNHRVVHKQDHTGRRSLCGVELPDECPTYYFTHEQLVRCHQCAGLELSYEGNILTGYYPTVRRKQ